MPNLPRPRLRRSTRSSGAPATAAPAEPNVEIVEHDGLRWINIERPGPLDRAWLEEHFVFHPLAYEDVASRNQRPKIDDFGEYLFIVLHFPVFDKKVGRLNAGELDVFIGADFLITLPNEPLPPVEYLFERVRTSEDAREQMFSQGLGYLLYKVVDDSVDYGFPMLRKMGNKLDRIEEEIFLEQAGEEIVRDISNVKQEIINFRKIIRPQRQVLRDLEKVKRRFLAEDHELYFDDVVDASERIWDMLENYKEVVEALEETNESVITHRLNNILRILTVFSVVFLPLTLISGIWGMNVRVPGEGHLGAFWIILGAMLALLVSMLAFFKNRGWL
ncbi:MAG: magnesium transporter CorA family protein [Thermoleophilaceae bacterium]